MSLPKPKTPVPPAAAPAPPDVTVASQKLGGENPESSIVQKRRKGRNALRIDLQHGGSGVAAGATGVNIPSK